MLTVSGFKVTLHDLLHLVQQDNFTQKEKMLADDT